MILSTVEQFYLSTYRCSSWRKNRIFTSTSEERVDKESNNYNGERRPRTFGKHKLNVTLRNLIKYEMENFLLFALTRDSRLERQEQEEPKKKLPLNY